MAANCDFSPAIDCRGSLRPPVQLNVSYKVGVNSLQQCDFEIKHSKEAIRAQCRHLLNAESCRQLETRFGRITGKFVLYRGEDMQSSWGIPYLNVSDFLQHLSELK